MANSKVTGRGEELPMFQSGGFEVMVHKRPANRIGAKKEQPI